jgi:hypothetical protein
MNTFRSLVSLVCLASASACLLVSALREWRLTLAALLLASVAATILPDDAGLRERPRTRRDPYA